LYHDCIHREVANLPTLELVWKAVILSKASVNYKEKRVALVEGEVIGAVLAILVVVGLGPGARSSTRERSGRLRRASVQNLLGARAREATAARPSPVDRFLSSFCYLFLFGPAH
jgi:hypothetical protein